MGQSYGWRHGAILLVMVLCSGLVGRRLVQLQIIQHDQLLQAARKQFNQVYTVQPQRGMIYDADGHPLVSNVPQYKVAFFPPQISEDEPAHRHAMLQVASTLGFLDPYTLWARVRHAQQVHLPYARLIPNEVSMEVEARLKALHVPWLDLVQHDVPAYPNGSLAAQVLGFVSPDPINPALGHGQYGLEQYYDPQLRGTPPPSASDAPPSAPQGSSLYLTISPEVQQEVESTLGTAVSSTRAEGGTVIVMDPRTGAILGMANSPTYDPNAYSAVAPNYSRYVNAAVSVPYEPGSTFKILTVAAGLDAGAFTPNTTVYDNGLAHCAGGFSITNWDNGNGWGWETPMVMLRHSANVGALQFARMMGAPTFYRYVKAFGFGQPTGIDLADEAAGRIRTPAAIDWTDCDLVTNSYGQGLLVTPLQLITAVAAVANDGWMMRPFVVRQIQTGTHVTTIHPQRVRQVISAATASVLTDILEESAKDGEAKAALVSGYGVAAKTGTAQVAGRGCNYTCDLGTIASLIGFAPAHHPRFIALVILRHPRTSPWGSTTAAPAFNKLASRLFLMMNIAPNTPDAR
ncbi:MAG: penicillin-binding protein 2 [Chloroflexota bacterium]